MKQTAIFPGRYVQAEGAIAELGEEIERLGLEGAAYRRQDGGRPRSSLPASRHCKGLSA